MFLISCTRCFAQSQTCPVNIDFSTGDLTHWYAYTGNNKDGNGSSITRQNYDSSQASPSGTRGVRTITEFRFPSVNGIQVITSNSRDAFGGFPTIPSINGYRYNYSILLGSTSITTGNGGGGDGGGYVRGVSYSIRVPDGPASEPYTMTYAYAMVLENGTHTSNQQPVISATLTTPAGIVQCASTSYFLPTLNNVMEGGRGATLDSATAIQNGFRVSSSSSPNLSPANNNNQQAYLQDVWTKAWTEVTFDLSAYRGQKVSLTFEADNCIPGGHFSYGYIAIRNSCAGLMISGDSLVCNNSLTTFSVPSLAGAIYNWQIPSNWTLVSSDTSNIIQVKADNNGGKIIVREKNSCADLSDTIAINTLPSPEAGQLQGSVEVCAGDNSSTLNLSNYSGNILNWLVSTDSISYSVLPNTSSTYIASNLNSSTFYRAVVSKGAVCPPDTSSVAIISVDQQSVGGAIAPAESILCAGQTAGEKLVLSGNQGSVTNWQFATDGLNWADQNPANPSGSNTVKNITLSTQYRAIVKNGVCPEVNSDPANILFNPVPFPEATITPTDTTICFATNAFLTANITVGTSYLWTQGLTGDGIVRTGADINQTVSPPSTTAYILSVKNNGCPNALLETFQVRVLAPVIVNAGNDTSVVAGEPLQFNALSSDAGPDIFLWEPSVNLSNVFIPDPVGNYSLADNIITYLVKATTPFGCSGEDSIRVKVFRTLPDIFVPNAFTPGTAVNALFRPIPVGVATLEFFRIYNRVGQLVFSTSSIGEGWDGSLRGVPQGSGGYVWMVKGTDYTGKVIAKKGTMVLIR